MPNDNFKSATKVIHSLIEVVAKGGSLLLGVGPTAEGTLLDVQVERLSEIGKWLDVNGEAIYKTRTTQNFNDKDIYFTKNDKNTHFALVKITENQSPNQVVSWTNNSPKTGSKIVLLSENLNLKWEKKGNKTFVYLPKELVEKYKSYPALALKFEI